MSEVRRGEIWLVSFDPARGSEQKGTRPAVIIQNDVGNQYANTTIIAGLSATITHYPQNVLLKATKHNGLDKDSCIKTGQLLTITKDRLLKKFGILSQKELEALNQALKLSLELP